MKDLMNVHEAAAVIGVHVETLRRYLAKGEIGGSLTPAGWRLTPSDISEWIEKYRQPRQPEQEPAHDR